MKMRNGVYSEMKEQYKERGNMRKKISKKRTEKIKRKQRPGRSQDDAMSAYEFRSRGDDGIGGILKTKLK